MSLLFGLCAATATLAHSASVTLLGNEALPDEVYRAVLALAAPPVPEESLEAQTDRTEIAISDFLHASGYELATVTATTAEGQIVVLIDEGRLDRMIFVGESAVGTFELKNALELVGNVFNRPLLDRRLEQLKRTRSGVVSVAYELVPLTDVEHQGIQIEDTPLLRALRIQRTQRAWELRITFHYTGWTPGFDLGFGYRPPDGLYARGGYLAPALLFTTDRVELQAELAMRLGAAAGTSAIGLSRAMAGAAYFGPAAFADVLRPFLELQGQILGRERPDVGLESYLFAPVTLILAAEVRLAPIRLTLGGGYEWRSLLSTTPLEGRTVTVPTEDQDHGRWLFEGRLEARFNPEELRRDRAHLLALSGRYNGQGSNDAEPFTELMFDYRRMIPYGWDELWIGAKAGLSFGDVPFYEELALGDGFLRAAFQQDYFVKRAAVAKLEYRVSLTRDLLKASVFDELLVFEALDALRQRQARRFGNSFGVGLHVLLFDAFQANLYLGAGVLSDGAFDIGLGLTVEQAF